MTCCFYNPTLPLSVTYIIEGHCLHVNAFQISMISLLFSFFLEINLEWNPGPEVINLISTQLSTKFILLINVKMPTINLRDL